MFASHYIVENWFWFIHKKFIHIHNYCGKTYGNGTKDNGTSTTKSHLTKKYCPILFYAVDDDQALINFLLSLKISENGWLALWNLNKVEEL